MTAHTDETVTQGYMMSNGVAAVDPMTLLAIVRGEEGVYVLDCAYLRMNWGSSTTSCSLQRKVRTDNHSYENYYNHPNWTHNDHRRDNYIYWRSPSPITQMRSTPPLCLRRLKLPYSPLPTKFHLKHLAHNGRGCMSRGRPGA